MLFVATLIAATTLIATAAPAPAATAATYTPRFVPGEWCVEGRETQGLGSPNQRRVWEDKVEVSMVPFNGYLLVTLSRVYWEEGTGDAHQGTLRSMLLRVPVGSVSPMRAWADFREGALQPGMVIRIDAAGMIYSMTTDRSDGVCPNSRR